MMFQKKDLPLLCDILQQWVFRKQEKRPTFYSPKLLEDKSQSKQKEVKFHTANVESTVGNQLNNLMCCLSLARPLVCFPLLCVTHLKSAKLPKQMNWSFRPTVMLRFRIPRGIVVQSTWVTSRGCSRCTCKSLPRRAKPVMCGNQQ